MTIYFVRTTGNDSTGDGSTGNPWATVSKALATVAAGDTVNIGTGTYAENTSSTGRLQITQVFASDVTLQSETGNAADVSIKGASDATINTIIQGGATHIYFKKLTFVQRANTTLYCVRLAQCASITFDTCTFTVTTNNAQINDGIRVQPSGSVAVSATVTNCTFNAVGTDVSRGFEVAWTAGNTITMTVTNCTGNMPENCIYANGGTWTVTGCNVTSTATHCLRFGADSNTGGNATTATVTGNRIICGSGHGIIFGNGCTNCVASGNNIDGGDHAFVLKEHTGSSVHDNFFTHANTAEVYFKAATSCSAFNNTILTNATIAAKLNAGDTGNKCASNVFRNNRVILYGTACVYSWGPSGSVDESDKSVSDKNQYRFLGTTGNFGIIGASTVLAKVDFSAVKSAWTAYGVSTNDSNSRLWPPARDIAFVGTGL